MAGHRFAVRAATSSDVAAIASVAAAAWRDTYAGLLRPETIETFIERAYAIERLERRIADDVFLVAEDASPGAAADAAGGARDSPFRIVAFCDARETDERVDLFAIYALPEIRGQGTGGAMLAALRARFPAKPIAAEVLDGNRKGEVFYERRGFSARERLETELFGEPVVEHRWWLDPG
jgi:GNAT superfamily N-acetyltransferase